MPPKLPLPDSFLPLSEPVLHILLAVAEQDRHGYGIMQDIAARTDGKLKLSPGTLYGCIRRMLEGGLIQELEERPDPAMDDERRRYYALTPLGRRVAMAELERLSSILGQARAVGFRPAKS